MMTFLSPHPRPSSIYVAMYVGARKRVARPPRGSGLEFQFSIADENDNK